MNLLAFIMQTGGHIAGWRHPLATDRALCDIDYFVSCARTAERGKFDAVFFADSLGYPGSRSAETFEGQETPKLDPLPLLSAVAPVTQRVGLIGTTSTTYNEPYATARRFATLDHISRGRAGWNIVTSTMENEAHNHGFERHMGHAERYQRAAEFIDAARKLWDSWQSGALLADQASGRYTDASRISAVNHSGKHFRIAGPLNLPRSPQGHPVLVQAGASADGKAFAARYAEVIFTSHPAIDSAIAFRKEMQDRASSFDRPKDAIKVLPAITPYIGRTREEAKAFKRELDELIPLPIALEKLETLLGGFDLSGLDLDGPLPALPPEYLEVQSSTRDRVLEAAGHEGATVRKLAYQVAGGRTSSAAIGTADDVADMLSEWYEAGAADGFIISPPVLATGLETFVDRVVPILQARGLFRKDYEGETLRDHLGLAAPENRYEEDPQLRIRPEIW